MSFVYVTPAARGLGVAGALLDTCLARAQARWARLRLHTQNPAAARLYESRGFRPSDADRDSTHVLALGG